MRSFTETVRTENQEPDFILVDAKVMRDGALSPNAKMVYMAVSVRANADTGTASLKISDIAKEACCAKRTVHESLKALTLRGVIDIEQQFDGNRQAANRYHVVGHKAKCYECRSRQITGNA
ncbi:MAG: helix-turn-helix domain-containing protein [Synergistaceae bacterium]|jgi:hypothetical protein|nr:helix-turn-helix domain-containing protein [Synergistaceae bacterium]